MDEFRWTDLDGRIQMGGFRWAGASARALLGTRVAIQCRKDAPVRSFRYLPVPFWYQFYNQGYVTQTRDSFRVQDAGFRS